MAKYLILIYDDEAAWASADQATYQEMMKAHNAFGEANADVLLGGEALQSTSTATTIRKDADAVTDGAFAETKEALGGYYLIDVPDLDRAIAVARQIPTLAGGVEVRPIVVFD